MPIDSFDSLRALPAVLRLGTRGSLLARTQSGMVAEMLRPHLPAGCSIELVVIATSGDEGSVGKATVFDKGLFVKEIDEQLLAGRIDFAVHSAKDLPAERPTGIVMAATPARANPADVWIGTGGIAIEALPVGAKVGTASLRRQAQLLAMRPDLAVVPLRGNIDTRLRKVAEGEGGISGTFLAAAGLMRANLLPAHAVVLATDAFIPAAGQGTLAVETRDGAGSLRDAAIASLVGRIHDALTGAALRFERQIVRAMGAGCLAPIGVCAEPRKGVGEESGWIARAIIASPDGKEAARCTLMARTPGPPQPEGLQALAALMQETLVKRGGLEILRQCQG